MPERFTFLIALLALLVAGLVLWRSLRPPPDPAPERTVDHEEEEGSVAPYMADLQRYAEKLYHAGASENWELARFYSHELEETAEAIERGGFAEDGQPLAPLVERWLTPTVERVEEARERAAFDAAYADLVAACNTCHAATEHAFVRITVPTANAFTNQEFAP